ncbi:rhomboid family intramembrane serine protease [Halorientalis sp. IM1011]|uniref:rhomboid family intramembrane serine protease n=1 Tax=Halorientalis sp. IM1011 TaxID=1932360 RepID=UPI00155FA167|nr:rhomboid family intramembrane serine protease [Halorientalis sp. IM1011]
MPSRPILSGWLPTVRALSQFKRKFPFTIFLIAGVGWLLVTNGVRIEDVFGPSPSPFNPIFHLSNQFFHASLDHYRGNMLVLVPLGVVLTLLTSDKHVLGVVVGADALASFVYHLGSGPVVGSSGIAFAIIGVLIVRTVGDAMQNASVEWLLTIMVGLFLPFFLVLFVVAVALHGTWVAHFGHLLSFAFGGMLEAAFVLVGHATDERLVLSW